MGPTPARTGQRDEARKGRRDLIDYFLAKKKHDPAMDEPSRREELAGMTFGYSPVMIEHLFDEALIWALRGGRDGTRRPMSLA